MIAEIRYNKGGKEHSCALHIPETGAKGLAHAAKYIYSQGGKIIRYSDVGNKWSESCDESKGGDIRSIVNKLSEAKKQVL